MLAIRSEDKGQHDRKGWPGHVIWGTMRLAIGASLLSFFVLTAAACGSDDPTATPVPEQPPEEQPTAEPTFEQEWAQLVAAAQEEGELLMSVGPLGEYRDLLDLFQATFDVEYKAQTGRGAYLADRVLAERQAGKKLVDIGLISVASTSRRLVPAGSTVSIPSLLIDPAVADESIWHDGQFWFADWFVEGAGDHSFIYAARVNDGYRFWYNTDKVSEEEAGAVNDLWEFVQDPKWRGLLGDRSWHDPGRLGGMIRAYFMPELGPEWITAYFNKGLATFTDDDRLVDDWLAQGVYPVQVTTSGGSPSGDLLELKEAGLPINSRDLQSETGWMEARGSGCCIVAFEGGPNPNAQKVFVNWWLSQDVQTRINAIEPGITRTSLRNDVPIGNVDPSYARTPGKKYVFRDGDPKYSGEEQEAARQFIVNTFLEETGWAGEVRN